MEQKVRECVKQIRKITDFEPQAALILSLIHISEPTRH